MMTGLCNMRCVFKMECEQKGLDRAGCLECEISELWISDMKMKMKKQTKQTNNNNNKKEKKLFFNRM